MDASKKIMLSPENYVHNSTTIMEGNVEKERQMFEEVFFGRSLSLDNTTDGNVNDNTFRVSNSTANSTSTDNIILRPSNTTVGHGKKRVSFTEIWKGDNGVNHVPHVDDTNVVAKGSKPTGEKTHRHKSSFKNTKVDETDSPTKRRENSNEICLRVLETKGSFDFLGFRPPTPPNASHLSK